MVAQAPAEIALPELTPHAGDPLAPHGDYDAVSFTDLDLSGQVANNARLLDCALFRCRADGLQLRRARFVETLVADLQAATIDLTESVWRDSLVAGGRHRRRRGVERKADAGAVPRLEAATSSTCAARPCRTSCSRTACSARSTSPTRKLTDVDFAGSRVDSLSVRNATLTRVDLSGATLHALQRPRPPARCDRSARHSCSTWPRCSPTTSASRSATHVT